MQDKSYTEFNVALQLIYAKYYIKQKVLEKQHYIIRETQSHCGRGENVGATFSANFLQLEERFSLPSFSLLQKLSS